MSEEMKMLDPALQAEILRLFFSEKLSLRKIAKQLNVDRKTVRKIIDRRYVATGPQERERRPSLLVPYHPRIKKLLEDAPGRSCVNILQRLREEEYLGGITILRDYVRALRPPPPKEAFFKLDFAPGEAAQVDWGEFGDVFLDGTKVHVFVMVLCFSRMLYVEFTLKETLPTLLRCYERALRFFGGRCREYWHDNMSTVVVERIGKLLRFTPKFSAYAGFHGFKAIACSVGEAHEKGRVENGVKLVRYQFWPGRHFQDIFDLNRQAVTWRDEFANRREHHATRKIPELLFEKEKVALLPLRPEPYDTDDVLSCKVSPFFRVLFETNTYSVPWTLVGKIVTVRANDQEVRIFYGPQKVAAHLRCYQKRKDIKNPAHEEGLKEFKGGAARTWQIEAVKSFGKNASRYLELIHAGTRSLRAELSELLCLATVYGPKEVDETLGQLLDQGIVGVNHLERALRLKNVQKKAPPPMQLGDEKLQFIPPAPSLDSYDALLLDAQKDQEKEEEEEA
jgi:transposase